jgi:hypothetical protein
LKPGGVRGCCTWSCSCLPGATGTAWRQSPGRYRHHRLRPDSFMVVTTHRFAGNSGERLPFRVGDIDDVSEHSPSKTLPDKCLSAATSRASLKPSICQLSIHSPPKPAMHLIICRSFWAALTMCDWVLPWCFLANSALGSPLPRADFGFKCAGSALLKEAIVMCRC